jgi:hypothetical protein
MTRLCCVACACASASATSALAPVTKPASSRLASWWQRWKAWWSSADADG